MEDNKRKLYDALSEDYDLGSFEQFSADIADDNKRRKLYDAAIEDYDFGDFDSFSSQLGFGKGAAARSDAESEFPQFDDEPDTRALNELERLRLEENARKEAEKAERRERQAQVAEGRAKFDEMRQRSGARTFGERISAANEAETAPKPSAQAPTSSVSEHLEQKNELVQRFGTGKEAYSADEAARVGKLYEDFSAENEALNRDIEQYNKTGKGDYTSLNERQRNQRLRADD